MGFLLQIGRYEISESETKEDSLTIVDSKFGDSKNISEDRFEELIMDILFEIKED